MTGGCWLQCIYYDETMSGQEKTTTKKKKKRQGKSKEPSKGGKQDIKSRQRRERHRTRPPLRLGLVETIETISSSQLPFNTSPSEFGSSHIASLSVRITELLKQPLPLTSRPRTTHKPERAQLRLFDAHRPPYSRHLLRTRVFDSFMRPRSTRNLARITLSCPPHASLSPVTARLRGH